MPFIAFAMKFVIDTLLQKIYSGIGNFVVFISTSEEKFSNFTINKEACKLSNFFISKTAISQFLF